jgi:membrane protease YdiL (CAAX protease family)
LAALAVTAATVVLRAAFEEAAFRWFLPECLRRMRVPPAAADVTAQVLFALAHVTAGWTAVVNALAAGTALLLVFRRTRSLVLVIAIHAAYNLVGLALLQS